MIAECIPNIVLPEKKTRLFRILRLLQKITNFLILSFINTNFQFVRQIVFFLEVFKIVYHFHCKIIFHNFNITTCIEKSGFVFKCCNLSLEENLVLLTFMKYRMSDVSSHPCKWHRRNSPV